MFALSVELVVVYLVFGLLTCLLARKGWPEDWDETLLAALLSPVLFALTATAVAASFVFDRLQTGTGRSGGRPSAA